ncbi:hypothetical protein [Mesorhizobium sp.]|uniref:hypothetical protein n=1 Tax=Mesorhizobium sp. TaxID=1871066 RepID=UPI000FE70B33|nr:hypothetical protein [Mesorhizobium sp.]RWH31144.1 MAG: hypothetical protein EOQ76_09785 [Mesorhizobium sp.]RWH41203.1 MAG: hypothetical protein EOQ79_02205 [Mesorhizobium sp.]TIR62351.1 MAG: hypothetical protein E5X22_01105 [Mesorhizobium sp.]TIR69446.1 MAG: hypothetical protein E5X24_12855 [Mesorhizobium sp.]
MATLNIQGRKVQVDDAFLSMTPEQQNAAVDEIAKSLPAASMSDAAEAADARAKAGIAAAQKIMDAGGPKPGSGHDAPDIASPRAMGASGTFLNSIGEGVPIVGPYVDKGLTATAAGLGSLLTGEPVSKVNREMTDIQQESRTAHPIARTAGNVTGAVAGTLPAMAAAPEAFGIGAATNLGKFGMGALSGGLISGADSAVRSGGDVRDTLKGGGLGLITGVAAPLVAPLIGKGVKAIANNVQLSSIAKALGLDKKAVGVLADAVRQDAIDPAAISQLGNDGMLMDLGPNLRHTAGAIAATPGEGKAIVRNAIGARDADANWRIRSTLNDTLGEAPTPSRVIDRADRNQLNLQPQYRDALREASDIDAAPIARYLDAEAQTLRGDVQKSIQRVRTMLNYVPTGEEIARARATGQPAPGGLIQDAGTLLNARQAVDDLLETAQGSNQLNALQTARQAIDDELAAKVPNIKEVDAKYAELARQKEAVQRGQTVLSSGREAPRPDELADEVGQGALPQGLQVGPSAVPLRIREGARAEIERIVGTNANDRVALQRLIKGEGDWNWARLSTLFGQDKAKAIIDLLDREKLFADTSNIVTRNSETAARIAAQDAIDAGGSGRGFGVREGFIAGGARGAARAAGTKAVERVIDALSNGGNEKAISDMARTLTSGPQQSAVLDALMKAGRGSPLQQSQVDRVARALLLGGSNVASRP